MIDYADSSLNPTTAGKVAELSRNSSSALAWAFGTLFFLPFVGLFLTVLFWQPYFGGGGAALSLILLVAAGKSAKQVRRRRSRLLMSYLLQAVQTRMPLSPMLKAAAEGESRAIANRIDRLRIALEDGSPAGSALLIAVPQTPLRTADLINAGERNGCLAAVLKSLVDQQPETQNLLEVRGFAQAYGLLVFATIATVIIFIDLFIMPRFQSIFQDFKIAPPRLVSVIISFGDIMAPLIGLTSVILLMLSAGSAMRQLLSPAKPYGNPLKGLTDHVIWWTPVAGSLARDRGLADVLGVAANAMEAGRPVDQAIQEGAMTHLNTVLRDRVESWAEGIRQGKLLHEAAADAWMPSILVGMLASGARTGNLPAAMRFLQRYYALRFSRIALLLRGAAVPALALFAGAIVLIAALGIYGPMISLVQAVSAPRHGW